MPADVCFQPAEMHNYRSVTGSAVRDKVEDTLLEEMACGNYKVVDHKPVIVSALNAIPKPGTGEIRLIHDCSQPAGVALNDYAECESFKYQSLEDAVELLKPGYYMAKVDLRHAYRSVGIHPSNFKATGLKWKFGDSKSFTYLVDTRLPYGGRRSAEIFHRLTQSVKRMMARKGYRAIIVYLDDFLVIGATWKECKEIFDCLILFLQELGFGINWKKVVPPTQRLTFLGVLLDTLSQTMSLPEVKLVALQAVLEGFLHRRRATKRQLQSLAGRLNWACRVVYGGRNFLRRILDAMNSMQSPSAKYKLTGDFYADLTWWIKFLSVFNGRHLFLDSKPVLDVQTDACYDAAGAYFAGDWSYFHFGSESPVLSALHINHKETLAVVLAAERWAPQWVNRHVIIHSDSQAAVAIINKGSTCNSLIMGYLRRPFWLSAIFNFRITARYIKGCDNAIADAISRLHCRTFLFKACSLISQETSFAGLCATPLLSHMPYASSLFLSIRYIGFCTWH